MKTILFLILFSLSQFLIAQQYHSFPTNDAVWRESRQLVFGASNYINENYQNFINGDTVYLGKTYHKIYKTGSDFGYDSNGSFNNYYSNVYVGAIREDSLKHVFLLGDPEILLYDFNLQLGDTLPQLYVDAVPAMYGTYNNNDLTYAVSEIDSVLVSGIYHKRFKLVFANGEGITYLIEGVGATTGLKSRFYGSYLNGYSSDLICFKQDNIDAYPDGVACDLVVVGINDISSKNQIHVYPNPSTGLINFTDSPNTAATLKVLSLAGKTIYEIQNKNLNESVDLSILPKGIYFLLVILEDNPPIIQKIILH